MAWLLRHGAQKEGIEIRPDGFVKMTDLVSLVLYLQTESQMLIKVVSEPKDEKSDISGRRGGREE